LFILNENLPKIGYFKSKYISPGVSNDGLSVNDNEGKLICPCELFYSAEKKMTLFVLRSGICAGKMRLFGEELN